MSEQKKSPLRRLFRTRFFTPAGFLVRAGQLAIAFFVVHAIGLREYTSILCGTLPSGDPPYAPVQVILAAVYLVLYFSAVLLVPVLVIGAGVMSILLRVKCFSRAADQHNRG